MQIVPGYCVASGLSMSQERSSSWEKLKDQVHDEHSRAGHVAYLQNLAICVFPFLQHCYGADLAGVKVLYTEPTEIQNQSNCCFI